MRARRMMRAMHIHNPLVSSYNLPIFYHAD